MLDIFNQYYEAAANGVAVTFQMTTNHPDHQFNDTGIASYASGYMNAHKNESIGENHVQLPALVSDTTKWHFLRSQDGHLEDFGTERDQLMLTLFYNPLHSAIAGSLQNFNWQEPVSIQALDVNRYDGFTHLFYGFDSNGAAIAIVLRQRLVK